VALLPLAEYVAETLDVGPGTRVFEVDCGDGAFLLPLHDNGYIVGGIDPDTSAIAQAMAAMPDGQFEVGAASALDPAIPWDVVICRSLVAPRDSSPVALADVDYMRGVLARMFAKATHAIAILHVPDDQRRWMLHALGEIGATTIQFDDASRVAGDEMDGSFNVFARSAS
jgi:hypothetical protein